MPATLAPAYVVTGFFFHQVHLVESKGWSLAWFASCFVAFAFVSVLTGLLLGPLIDRIGAIRLSLGFLLPLGVALAIQVVADHAVAALGFMVFAGMTSGAAQTVMNAVWAEIYGVLHLGAIRAAVWGLVVVASALSPASLGWLIDSGVPMETLAVSCLGWIVTGTGILWFAIRAIGTEATC